MDRTTEQGVSTRTRWLAVGGLVLATAVTGAAARGTLWPVARTTGGPGPVLSAGAGGPVSLTGRLDRTAVQVGGDPTVRMELVIGGEARPGGAVRVPTDLVVVLDQSGSMAGAKLDYAKAAIRQLIDRLGVEDRFGLVVYSSGAWVAIPLDEAGGGRERWRPTVDGIMPQGGTNIASGLDLGQRLVESARQPGRTARLILISDGLANEGDSSHEGLVARGSRAARAEYMLTTVGVGADFNEYLMTALADAGTGNYYYLRNAADMEAVFAGEFAAAQTTVASGLEVRIVPRPGVHVTDAAGYPLERAGSAVLFRPGALFAGQRRTVWVSLAVPNGSPGEDGIGDVSVTYTAAGERATVPLPGALRVARVESETEMLGRLDVPAWTRGIVVERYNQMKEEVARAVKAGEEGKARDAIEQFRSSTRAMNQRVQAPAVQEKLDSLTRLEQSVAKGFMGANQVEAQNELSKDLNASAVDERRAGSKR